MWWKYSLKFIIDLYLKKEASKDLIKDWAVAYESETGDSSLINITPDELLLTITKFNGLSYYNRLFGTFTKSYILHNLADEARYSLSNANGISLIGSRSRTNTYSKYFTFVTAPHP